MRVLVVEDERNLADAITRGLRKRGMAVDVAYDGDSGHEMAFVTRYDVVVLDRDLPGMPGDQICAELAASGALTRVLMLTASGTVADRVRGCSWALTTICPSRSPSTNWSPGCRRWGVGPPRLLRRCWRWPTWCSTRPGGRPPGPTCRST